MDLDRGSARDRRHMQNLTFEKGVPIRMKHWEPRIAWVSNNLIRNGIRRFDRCGFNQHRAVGTYAAGNVDPIPLHSVPLFRRALSPPSQIVPALLFPSPSRPGKLAGAAGPLVVFRNCQTECSAPGSRVLSWPGRPFANRDGDEMQAATPEQIAQDAYRRFINQKVIINAFRSAHVDAIVERTLRPQHQLTLGWDG